MPTSYNSDPSEIDMNFVPPLDRIERKVARLKALLDMGGTMENKGATLHVQSLRIDVAGLADMDEAVWSNVRRSIGELTGFEQRSKRLDPGTGHSQQ